MCLNLQKKIIDAISAPNAEFCRKGTILFNQTLLFRKEKLQFQMQEEGVVQKNSKTPTQRKRKQSF
jgi:hypothetical protein